MHKIKKLPTVAIVGRPNVGKSSLFNAICGRRTAIVHEQSGVTRDRIISPVVKMGCHFQLVDTGGLATSKGQSKKIDIWDAEITRQVEIAVEEADLIYFITDSHSGITAMDEEVAHFLRNFSDKVFLVPNKADNDRFETESIEFASLGFEKIFPVSCTHRKGINKLLSESLPFLRKSDVNSQKSSAETENFKIAVVGRPNVGKSSLVNRLLGEKRVMVSDIPGTTRDSVNTDFSIEYKGEQIPASLIDTAGLRKKSKVKNILEYFSVKRGYGAVNRADMAIFVVESNSDGLTAQDRKIASVLKDSGVAVLIAANKWDECRGVRQKNVLREIRRTLPGMNYAPLVFTSALSAYNFSNLMDTVSELIEQMELRVSTGLFNRILQNALAEFSPPMKTKRLKIFYGTMISNRPPTFRIFVNSPRYCAANYLKYLENQIRDNFGFTGLPIRIQLKARPKKK